MTGSQPNFKAVGILDVDFGKNVTVIRPANLYRCIIKDNCFIGPFVEIQANAIIGARTRVQSHSFICELVSICEDCFIGHGVMFINDLFETGRPAYENKDLWRPTALGNRVSVGSNSTILPVNICDDVVIGAGSVVIKDIIRSGVYLGNPAVFVDDIKNRPQNYF